MNRADLMRVAAMASALAAAARELLVNEARQEWVDNNTRVTWSPPGFTAAASITHPTLEVVDDQAFLTWVAERHPTEVTTVRRARNTEWLKQLRDRLADEVAAGRADAPPGTKLDDGGEFKTLSIEADRSLKQGLAEVARLALGQGIWPDPPTMWSAAQQVMKAEAGWTVDELREHVAGADRLTGM